MFLRRISPQATPTKHLRQKVNFTKNNTCSLIACFSCDFNYNFVPLQPVKKKLNLYI
jgi:hypothetical protein